MATVDTSKTREERAKPAGEPEAKSRTDAGLTNVSVTRTKSAAAKKAVKVTTEQRRQLIAEAAYIRAEKRGFEGGDPVVDWLEAEQEVDQGLPQRTE